MGLKIKKVNKGIELLIITGMLIDDEFIKKISLKIKPHHFTVPYAGTICKWCLEFCNSLETKEAPKRDILELYEANKDELDEEYMSLTKTFLNNVLTQYNDKKFSTDYVYKKAKAYIRKREAFLIHEKAGLELNMGNIDGFFQISQKLTISAFEETGETFDLWDEKVGDAAYKRKDFPIMTFSGEINEMFQPLRRGMVIGILGKAKVGKTFWLLEWAYQGLMSGLNVIFFSLEMPYPEIEARLVERITGKELIPGSRKGKKIYNIPVFDCYKNQTDDCEKKQCVSRGSKVVNEFGQTIEYSNKIPHMPCTYCRGKNNLFTPSTWFEEYKTGFYSKKESQKRIRDLRKYTSGGSLKIRCYPIKTANARDFENDLIELELTKNWVPDLMIFDYVGIMKENANIGEKRLRMGENCMDISKITKERNTLSISGFQTNRGGVGKDWLDETDIGEDFSIMQTLDALYGINEIGSASTSPIAKDKFWNRQRINLINRREGGVRTDRYCMTLHDRSRSQICLDSVMMRDI